MLGSVTTPATPYLRSPVRMPLMQATPLVLSCLLAFGVAACKPAAPPAPPVRPDESRFTPVVLLQGTELDEPMTFAVAPDGRVFIAERKGTVKLYHPDTDTAEVVANIAVNTKYTSKEGEVREAEEGLVGLTIHPDFDHKPWVYLLHSHPTEAKHVLERFDFRNGKLDVTSRKLVLEYPVQRETCCHTGGGMVWDRAGNLFMTIGNNTANSPGAQTDERPGREAWDDQRGSANTNDLRGKIIRIHPEDDGSYSIPEGNLFPKGTPDTRPEIYTMGDRNPWRPSIDSQTGFLYWGEVGPDANEDTSIGPRGYDELNQARGPGYFGWPYFIGENHAYPYFDYAANQPREPKNPKKPINASVNNTGLRELPPAQPAFISYPYGASERFPMVGSGSRSAVGGPVFRQADFQGAKRAFPAWYEGKWLAADLSRGWIMAITMNAKGDYQSMERFLPAYRPVEPIDLKFGPEGDLYVLEYGSFWFGNGGDDKLVRIEYNAGNRKPVAVATADRLGGAVPLRLKLSSAGSRDPDGDALAYEWTVSGTRGPPRVFKDADPVVTFDAKGQFTAVLKVTDPAGAGNSVSLELTAGNSAPDVSLKLAGNSQFHFPGVPLQYTVAVGDSEDGSTADGRIRPEEVAVSIDYISQGLDYAETIQGQRSVDDSARHAVASALMGTQDCRNCHLPDTRSAGPAFREIANRYRGHPEAPAKLAAKVRAGGTGVWGDIAMPAHPGLSANDAQLLVRYILASGERTRSTLPLAGTHVTVLPAGDTGNGTVVIRAAYRDRGAGDVPSLLSARAFTLRAPTFVAPQAPLQHDTTTIQTWNGQGADKVLVRQGSYLGFRQLDLTAVNRVALVADTSPREQSVGGRVEIRLDSPTGPVVGTAELAPGIDPMMAALAAMMKDINAAGAKTATENKAAAAQQRKPKVFAFPAILEATPTIVKLPPVAGTHDFYLTFSNAKARPADTLMGITRLSLVHQTSP